MQCHWITKTYMYQHSLFLSYNKNFRNQSLKLTFENRKLREAAIWETTKNVREAEV